MSGPGVERPTVAIMAPGDMGHTVGGVLVANGLRVITCLVGRSARTRGLAEKAGIEPVADDAALIHEANLLLSILVPAQAFQLARRIADALERTPSSLVYVDCNAVAPQTARRIGELVEASGASFVDAGIIGPPPKPGARTVIYASGANVNALSPLRDHGLDIREVSARPGDASALKMCYAAMTKGTTAVMSELAIAADRLGIAGALHEELAQSQSAAAARMERAVPDMVPKAHRWVGEMEEIAKTFEHCGLTPDIFLGAAALYGMVADTPLGKTDQEAWRGKDRSLEDVIKLLAAREH
ncbi:MAG: DUF1932 domain-containing protein [Pseudomonadota bacterium]